MVAAVKLNFDLALRHGEPVRAKKRNEPINLRRQQLVVPGNLFTTTSGRRLLTKIYGQLDNIIRRSANVRLATSPKV